MVVRRLNRLTVDRKLLLIDIVTPTSAAIIHALDLPGAMPHVLLSLGKGV